MFITGVAEIFPNVFESLSRLEKLISIFAGVLANISLLSLMSLGFCCFGLFSK